MEQENILLTEELLLSFGFEKIVYNSDKIGYLGMDYRLKHKDFLLVYCDDFSIGIMGHEDDIGIAPDIELFRYVHQLQNLYFILTGEQLKTK
jgi:hypothetical protein